MTSLQYSTVHCVILTRPIRHELLRQTAIDLHAGSVCHKDTVTELSVDDCDN